MDNGPVFDQADDAMTEQQQVNASRYRQTEWALAEAARCGTPREALAILESETGVYL